MKTLVKNSKRVSSFILIVMLLTLLFSNSSYNQVYAKNMKLEVGQIYHGFKLIEERNLKDIESIGRIFYHEKSGARLLQIENKECLIF